MPRFSTSIRDGEFEAKRWGIQAFKYIVEFRSRVKKNKDAIKEN